MNFLAPVQPKVISLPHGRRGPTAVAAGRSVIVDSEDCIVVGEDAPIAILGVKGLAVIQKNGATLVCPIERSEEIRKIVTEMEERGWEA